MAWRTIDSRLGRVARFAAGALISISALAAAASPADARHYRHHHYAYHAHVAHYRQVARNDSRSTEIPSSPAFSCLVVDANSGRPLYSVAPDGLRHPASITKVMTLYLLFEQLEKGALTMQSRIPVSEHAASQEPSKLGVGAGDTISVDDAIKAVVTRSANDIAVAIAESIGGSESAFAELMTRKAHALGMASTVYRNASGLPNDEQVTTAHDLALLGRAIEERFPKYFRYFSTHEFEYAGEVIGNHNHLLGRIDGVDGIKTGYTRGSGFNLLTSVHRGGRSLIAVVMGGRTAGARDRVMENLIEDHIAAASTVRTSTMVADADNDAPAPPAAEQSPRVRPVLVAANVPAHLAAAQAAPQDSEGDNSEDDDKPALRVAAGTPPVEARQVAEDRSAATPARKPASAENAPESRAVAQLAATAPQRSPAALGWVKGPDAVKEGQAAEAPIPPVKPKELDAVARNDARPAQTTVAARSAGKAEDPSETPVGKGWMIQIGATDDASKANALLSKARAQSLGALAAAKPLTEKVQKGDGTFYRARFAGLDSASAESACRSLKHNGFSCFASRD